MKEIYKKILLLPCLIPCFIPATMSLAAEEPASSSPRIRLKSVSGFRFSSVSYKLGTILEDTEILLPAKNAELRVSLKEGDTVRILLDEDEEPSIKDLGTLQESKESREAIRIQYGEFSGFVWKDLIEEQKPEEMAKTPEMKTETDSNQEAPIAAPDYQGPDYQGPDYQGGVLTPSIGTIIGPSGKETYYNLDMSGVVSNSHRDGIEGDYWVREDGVKMLGDNILAACDVSGIVHNRYDLVSTSLGTAICADTGTFALSAPTQIDIATAW